MKFKFSLMLLIGGLVLCEEMLACTFFTIEGHGQFCYGNIEDASDGRVYFWIRPETDEGHGGWYIGGEDFYPQGGMNSQGLIMDWVAGDFSNYRDSKDRMDSSGFLEYQVMEQCSSTQEALVMFQEYNFYPFRFAKVLISDSDWDSAILQYRRGAFQELKPASPRDDSLWEWLIAGYGYYPVLRGIREMQSMELSSLASLLYSGRQWGGLPTVYSYLAYPEERRLELFYRDNMQEYLPIHVPSLVSSGEVSVAVEPLFSNVRQMECREVSPGEFQFQWQGKAGSFYTLEAASDSSFTDGRVVVQGYGQELQGRSPWYNDQVKRFLHRGDLQPGEQFWRLRAKAEDSETFETLTLAQVISD